MAKAIWPGVSLCVCVGAALGGAVSLFAPLTAPHSQMHSSVAAFFAPAPEELEAKRQSMIERDIGSVRLAVTRVANAALNLSKTVTTKAGDTLGDVLQRAGVDRSVTIDIAEAMREVYNPRRLQSGQAMTLNFVEYPHTNDRKLTELSFELSPGQSVAVERADDGTFSARKIVAETHREMARYDGVINSSLFAAATEAGLPDVVLRDMVKLFSYDVDFQRDIQPGDGFSVMFEQVVTKDGRIVRTEGIKVASMKLSGTTLKLYAFKHSDGFIDFYNEKGEGVRKALLRTPINGAQLTSGFGMRQHPILGYSTMHRGIDFGAPTGTPVFAAGDGVIDKREVFGSYGNYVRIRHGSGFSTAYAHLNRFGTDVQVGKRVRQNQIIGYVGTTGRSTGPHLHYEVLRDNQQLNPMSVKLPASQKLDGATLARFKETRSTTDRQYAELAQSSSVAMLIPNEETTALR